MTELELIICAKKPIRTLEDYALVLAGIPPLRATAKKALQDPERQRLYQSCLRELQHAVNVGALPAAPDKFGGGGHSYSCTFQDFITWTKASGFETPIESGFESPKETDKIYNKRKADFDQWRLETGIDLQALTTESIFEQVQQQRDKKLWRIGYDSFKRSFWPCYSKENGLKKRAGRTPKI